MQSQGRLRLINQNRKWKKVSVITHIFFHQTPKKKNVKNAAINLVSFLLFKPTMPENKRFDNLTGRRAYL